MSIGKKAKKAKHFAKGAAATVAEKAGPKLETVKHLAMGTAAEYPNATKAVAGGLAAGAAGAVVKKALDEKEESGDTDSETDEAPEKPNYKRAASGAHIITVKDPESTAYKVASKFGSPDETDEGYRFSLTDDEYSRFKREVA